MTKVCVEPGVCGFTTTITAESEDGMEVTVKVESGCPNVQKMAGELGEELEAFDILMPSSPEDRFIPMVTSKYNFHAACPVLAGFCKCIEAECGLALKKDASIRFID